MSQSPRPSLLDPSGLVRTENHSLTLLATSGCSRGLPFLSWPCVQSSRNATQRGSDNLKKKCSELLSTGVTPDRAENGLIRSVGAYTAPQTSQLSPYWSLAWHFGHSPLMKRSGRNMFFSVSKNCSITLVSISEPCGLSRRSR